MKTFYTAILLFLILLAVIICNTVFIGSVTATLEQKIASLPSCDQAAPALRELQTYWEAKRQRLALSVSLDDICLVRERIAELQATAAAPDETQFKIAQALALSALRRIREAEGFSWVNVF